MLKFKKFWTFFLGQDYKDAEGKSRPRCDLLPNLEQNGCVDVSNPDSSSNKTKVSAASQIIWLWLAAVHKCVGSKL